MNEITHIHLGRQSFVIANDAHKALRDYIEAIKHHAGSEVIKEVEIRMAELLSEHGVSNDKVVLIEDVDYLKSQLGSPQDFGDDVQSNEAETGSARARRLFRDTDHAMIAGVAAGLAAYLNIDVFVIRILFLVSFFTGGWGVLLYLILWLTVSPAKTSSEYLQMHGQPVTVGSLKQAINRADVAGVTRRVHVYVGKFLGSFAKVILTILGIGLVTTALGILTVVVASGVYMLRHHGTVFQNGFFPIGANETAAALLALGMITIIGIFLALTGIAMVRRKWSTPGWMVASLIALFFVSGAVTTALSVDVVPNVKHRLEAANHSVTYHVAPFNRIVAKNIVYSEYQESSDYSVELHYIGDPDPSRVKVKVENGVLVVDASAFQEDDKCQKQCWLDNNDLTLIVRAPSEPVVVDDPSVIVPDAPLLPVVQ